MPRVLHLLLAIVTGSAARRSHSGCHWVHPGGLWQRQRQV